MKKIRKFVTRGILCFLLYLFLGICLSYARQPRVSQEYQDAFQPADFYSDTVSCDRACIIEDNEEALELRLRMIAQARERIVLSTFEFRADESGKDILSALMAAAKRGVEVKILADGASVYLQMDRNPYFYALSTMENVEIKIYNRVNPLLPWTTMGRLHDKYLLIDDYAYLLGGRNTYDYFLGDNGYKNYDRDVFVYCTEPGSAESSVGQLEDYFSGVWQQKECRLFYDNPKNARRSSVAAAAEELEDRYRTLGEEYGLDQEPDYQGMTFETEKITLLTNPTHVYAKEPWIFYSLAELMKDAKGEILIHTPYVICNDWMYDSFREICKQNPEVSLLTNSAANNGNPFGAADYRMNRDKLLDTGLTLYEYEGGVSYHGKSIVMGEELSAVGSFNMDMRSVYLDTEMMLVIDSREVTAQLKEYLTAYEEESVKVLPDGTREIPEGVTPQELTGKRKILVFLVGLFDWLRFLM